jgi:VIT1/CCC1 family predicted Fe2+/Mn2+ transporter
VVWGAALIAGLSWVIARSQGASPRRVVLEHLAVGAVVVVTTHLFGEWVGALFRQG